MGCACRSRTDELVTCRTITSAFGPHNVIEALCNDQDPHTVAGLDGSSGQCSGAASLQGAAVLLGVTLAASAIVAVSTSLGSV